MRLAIVLGFLVAVAMPARAQPPQCFAPLPSVPHSSEADGSAAWVGEIRLVYADFDPLAQQLNRFGFETETSADTAYLKITLHRQIAAATTFYTTPDKTHLCSLGRMPPGRYSVLVQAVDARGRPGASSQTTVWLGEVPQAVCGTMLNKQREDRETISAQGVAGLVVLFLVCGFISIGRTLGTPTTGDAIELHVADEIARVTSFYARGLVVAYAAALVGLLFHGTSFIAVAAVVLLALFPLGALLGARRVRRELTADRARAELRGTLLIVRSETGQARVYASRRVIAAAQSPGLPTSVAR